MLFLLFFIIDLYCLIFAVAAQIFIAIVELAIPLGTQTNQANAAIQMQAVIAKDKISKFSA